MNSHSRPASASPTSRKAPRTTSSCRFAFGLVNHSVTGGNRTGLARVIHSIRHPAHPTCSARSSSATTQICRRRTTSDGPDALGIRRADRRGDAFGNFAASYGNDSDLADGMQAIDQLPQATLLIATLNYTAATELLTLTLQDSSLAFLDTGLPALDLSFISPSFAVDSLAIMAYADGYNSFYPSTPALIGDMTIHQIGVTLLGTGADDCAAASHRRRGARFRQEAARLESRCREEGLHTHRTARGGGNHCHPQRADRWPCHRAQRWPAHGPSARIRSAS